MHARERHRLALQALEEHGEVTVAQLSRTTGVSEMTIRRDLEALERKGLLRRVHGGAITAVSRGYEPPFALRASRRGDEKVRIGQAAAALVGEAEALIIDVGTTPLELARALTARTGLTILTPNLRAAELLTQNPDLRVIVTGGIARPGELSLVGDLAERAFADLRCDTVFLGAGGIDPDAGVTEFNLDDARVKRAALASARRCVVLADSTKLERVAVASVCPLDRVDVLVTDEGASDDVVARFVEHEVEVVRA
ncbi:MAG TPA: DeoR/GlpR family DNA-binding transcription regulator [Baekduia sp.]|nr:DeoR/GlpR family DNA-binding transcription regulator [Baekduia sp.]